MKGLAAWRGRRRPEGPETLARRMEARPPRAARSATGATTEAPLHFDDAFLRRLERMSLRLDRVGDAIGGRPGTRRVPAADFIDHRPYSPGDDLRHIDWNAAARHDEVFVKVGRVLQAAEVHLLLDASASMSALPGKWRMARELAAALAWMTLARGDSLRLTSFPVGEASIAWAPARGTGRGRELLAELSTLPVQTASASLLEPVVQAALRGARGGLLVLISDLWLADDLDRALALAPSPRWDRLILQVLHPAELRPEALGSVELVDAESGQSLPLHLDARLCDAYRAAMTARLERLRQSAARQRASYALLSSDRAIEAAVIPFLQRLAILEA